MQKQVHLGKGGELRVAPRNGIGELRVAAAMAGECRTLPLLVPNLLANVLKPLHADLYMDVALRSSAGVKQRSFMDYHFTMSNRTWAQVLAALRPEHVRVEDGDGDKLTYYGLFTRWARLHEAIESREERRQLQYHWVVRVRPDLAYTCRMTPRLLLRSGKHSLLKWDFVAAFPRETARIALTVGSRDHCPCNRTVDVCIPSLLRVTRRPFAQAWQTQIRVMTALPPKTCWGITVSRNHSSIVDTPMTEFRAPHCFDPHLIVVLLRGRPNATSHAHVGHLEAESPRPHCAVEAFQFGEEYRGQPSHVEEGGPVPLDPLPDLCSPRPTMPPRRPERLSRLHVIAGAFMVVVAVLVGLVGRGAVCVWPCDGAL